MNATAIHCDGEAGSKSHYEQNEVLLGINYQ